MAEIVRYVDTGSDAAGDGTTPATSSGDSTHAYQSLNQWEAAEETDLDTANNTHTVHCNRTNAGGVDQLLCDIDGWTTSTTDFITIIADDFPTDGIYDSTKYTLHNNNTLFSGVLILQEDYIRVVNLQVLVTAIDVGVRYGINNGAVNAGSDLRIDSCIVKGDCTGVNGAIGINCSEADITMTVFNTSIYGFISDSDPGTAAFWGTFLGNSTNFNLYNCSIFSNYYGFQRGAGTATAINCAFFNNTDDFDGTITATYCALGQHAAAGTNIDITDTWDTTCFTDPEADPPDVSVQDVDSPVYQTGNGATPKSLFTDDIIGTTRDIVDLNWDIGAFEFVSEEPPVGMAGAMTTNTGYWGY